MRRMALRWLAGAGAVYAAVSLVPGIAAGDDWSVYFLVALLLGLVNAFVAPLLRLLACPLMLLSLGLFGLVINALMLRLAAWVAAQLGIAFLVQGWWPALLGALVISVVNAVLGSLLGADRPSRRAR